MLKKVSHANYLPSLHGAFGKSEEAIYFNEFVDVEERSDSVFISMSQDLIYNINQGNVKTPKYMALCIN